MVILLSFSLNNKLTVYKLQIAVLYLSLRVLEELQQKMKIAFSNLYALHSIKKKLSRKSLWRKRIFRKIFLLFFLRKNVWISAVPCYLHRSCLYFLRSYSHLSHGYFHISLAKSSAPSSASACFNVQLVSLLFGPSSTFILYFVWYIPMPVVRKGDDASVENYYYNRKNNSSLSYSLIYFSSLIFPVCLGDISSRCTYSVAYSCFVSKRYKEFFRIWHDLCFR